MCRIFFALTLVVRSLLHLLVASVAARDLNAILKVTNNPMEKIANKVLKMVGGVDVNDLIKEFTIPLAFYIFLGVWLFILTCIYPWKRTHKSRLTLYAIMHLFFMLAVVYMVYIRGMINVAKVSVELSKIVGEETVPVYEFMAQPELYPISLVLDVLTFLAAVTSVEKSDGDIVGTLPLYRMVSGVSVRVSGGQSPATPNGAWTADSAKLISPPAYAPIQTSPIHSSYPSTRIGG
ncbi:RNA-directed RNA polymerase L [Frankliniella fusca]|uniref:RNA-directed RNA polymerase L n=1 Tax=Frankliniella fusca TaxID=407009 RepID=A0AAE1H012_9NEOP|nr:RNA-directed RNA polymerase L [Frankliniella fusca]